jgi:RNA polymerase sigma-70 factor (sigma-E family)
MTLFGPGADFDAFVHQSTPQLLHFAFRLTGQREAAEDLLQLAYVRLAGQWSRARDSPGAYARRTLVNLSTDRWRQRSRRPVEVPLDPLRVPDGTSGSGVEERDELMVALRALPPRQRAVLVLRYWEDLSVDETARLLGCSTGNVKSTASRGLVRLRDVLQTEGVST